MRNVSHLFTLVNRPPRNPSRCSMSRLDQFRRNSSAVKGFAGGTGVAPTKTPNFAAAPDGTLYFTTRSSTTGNYDIIGFAESGGTLRPNGQHATTGSIKALRLSFTARGVEENGVVLIPNDSASTWPTVTRSITDGVG